MKYKLYGNGADDDFPAIQEMLDSGICRVTLPPPEKHYVIGNTLKIHSDQELRLPAFARVVLKAGANCAMLENADFDNGNKNVCLNGGVWDMNHNAQNPNPYHFPDPVTGRKFEDEIKRLRFDKTTSKTLVRGCYTGMCFRFCTVKNLVFKNITVVNPVVYGVQCAYTEDFTFENIVFRVQRGQPETVEYGRHPHRRRLQERRFPQPERRLPRRFAGVHCRRQPARPDFRYGSGRHFRRRLPQRGAHAFGGHAVKNIHIRDIYGSFYVYCICMTKYYEDRPARGSFDNIVIENVYARFCDGTKDVPGHWAPLIQIGKNVDIGSIAFRDIHRDEDNFAIETIGVEENTVIGKMTVYSAVQRNAAGGEMPFIKNEGKICTLVLDGVDTGGEKAIVGSGTAERR